MRLRLFTFTMLALGALAGSNLLTGLTVDSSSEASDATGYLHLASNAIDGRVVDVTGRFHSLSEAGTYQWWRANFAAAQTVRTVFVSTLDSTNALRKNNFIVTVGDSADVCLNAVCHTVTNGASGWYTCAEPLTGLYFGLC